MQFPIGSDLHYQLTTGNVRDVIWDMNNSVNPHASVMGMSGAGKSVFLRKLSTALGTAGIQTHIFDAHGDLGTQNESAVLYSETSGYGINPLEINPDKHFGGVRKRIESFIKVIEKSTSALGVKQIGSLRNLLVELYAFYGLDIDDPNTWGLVNQSQSNGLIYLDVPFEQKDVAKKHGARWNPGAKCWCIQARAYTSVVRDMFKIKAVEGAEIRKYPTLSDLTNFIYTKMEESFTGVGREAMVALQEFHKASARLNKHISDMHYNDQASEIFEDEKFLKIKDSVRAAVESYLDTPTAGETTMQDAMLYSNYDTLNGVYQRVKSLQASGIFKSTPPPFNLNARVFRHNIAPLSRSEQKMFVLFQLQKMFDEAVQMGETKEIRKVIVLDESGRYFDSDAENPVNIIATEGRKFGLALVAAAQHPDQYSPEFLSSVATKVVLGLDEAYWDAARRKLNIPKERLASVRPHESILFQTKAKGNTNAKWLDVSTANQLRVAS